MSDDINPYMPKRLPEIEIDWLKLIPKIAIANRAVAKFNGILTALSNPTLLLSPLMITEATASSKMEGTQVDTVEVLKFEADVEEKSESKKLDIFEVLNYRKAINCGVDSLDDRGLTLSFIKELHSLLLSGVRGADKNPGEFRKLQNYIGSQALGIERARFIPPYPFQVQELMENLVEYLNFEEKDVLVQAAIMHAQFEIIHPFNDGNGRLGRMMIPLFLFKKGVISKPYLYISKYLEQNEMLYKDSLLYITKEGNWTAWIEMFLDAIIWQSEYNFRLANDILKYYENCKAKIVATISSQYAIPLLDAMMVKPIFKQNNLNFENAPTKPTVYALIQRFEQLGVVKTIIPAAGRVGATYVLKDLINIVEDSNIF